VLRSTKTIALDTSSIRHDVDDAAAARYCRGDVADAVAICRTVSCLGTGEMNTPLQVMVHSRLGIMQIFTTHGSVVGHGVVLSEIVGPVADAFVPVEFELFLSFAILEPKTFHVDGFGSSYFNRVIGNANCRTVVSSDVGGRLWVSHFFEGDSDWERILAVVEHRTIFGLGGGREDGFHDGAIGFDSSVHRRRRIGGQGLALMISWRAAEEKQPTKAATCFAFGEIGCVCVEVQDRTGPVIANRSVGVGGEVVE
jgi:hypothetical protein